jgi:C1A family cysteine protease
MIATVVACAYLLGTWIYPSGEIESDFQKFVAEHRKSYFSKDEYNYRLSVFEANVKEVEALNANPNDEAYYEINHYGDWTRAERDQLLGLANMPIEDSVPTFDARPTADSVDWRNTQDVTPVKDQGSCGSCWSFSAIEAVESCWAIQHGHELFTLSEQELVDCSGKYGNHGCSGGWQHWAMDYIKDKKGIAAEDEYPYVAKNQVCSANYDVRHAPITGYETVAKKESALEAALEKGPVAIAVDASNWSYYKGGDFSNCGSRLNHAVDAVGFDDTHWIVRNSWAARWGESGFIYLKKGNTCGILEKAYLPTC